MTPPPAMVAFIRESSSSSPRIANCKCLGVIRFIFKSLDALPASSKTSAVRYSRIAAEYTAAVAATRRPVEECFFKWRWTRPTGNWRPERSDLEIALLRFFASVLTCLGGISQLNFSFVVSA